MNAMASNQVVLSQGRIRRRVVVSLVAVQLLGLGTVFGQAGSGNGPVTSGLDPRVNPALNLIPRAATAEEKMQFERSRMENRWLRRESNAFGRLDQGLINDERAARQSRERLDDQRKGLMKFLNGLDSARNAAAFRKSIQQLEQTPELATLLGTELPPIGARHFGSTSKLFGMVRQDGSLETPPPPLVSDEPGDALIAAQSRFEETWTKAVEAIVDERPISRQMIEALRRDLNSWRETAAPAIAKASRSGQSHSRVYLNSLDRLIELLNDPQRTRQLRTFVQGQGFGFPGGTIADLLQHVQQNNLAVSYGSPPQMILAELGHDYLRDLDSQIALVDQRIEHFKAQNPSHNSALKERLIGQSHPPPSMGAGAYVDPSTGITVFNMSSGTGPAAPVPSQFTYPPGQQPAGLGSAAYTRSLPKHLDSQRSMRPATSADRLQFRPIPLPTPMATQFHRQFSVAAPPVVSLWSALGNSTGNMNRR